MPKPGFWEQPGRSPIVAAIVVTGLVVAVYSFAGGLLANGIMLADMVSQAITSGNFSFHAGGDYLESVKQVYERYRAMILIVTVAMQFLVFLGGTAWLFRKWHGGSIRGYFKLRAPKPGTLLLPLLGLAAIFPLAIFLGELSVRAFPFLKKLEEVDSSLVMAFSPVELILILATIGLTPAICEEFLFRGYFQNTLSRGMSQPWSYIITGTCFALIHQNYFGLGTLILVGVYLGFVFTRFGSIWSGSIVHFCYNSLLVLMVNQSQYFDWLFGTDGFIRTEAIIISLVTAPLVIWLIVSLTRPKLAEAPIAGSTDTNWGNN